MRILALLLALLPLFARAEDDPVVDGDLAKSLARAVDNQMKGAFWGTILVAREGKVVFAKGYGSQDYKQIPNTPRSLFEIASTSKMFTAIAILKLETMGKLATTDPISKYFKDVPADKKAITIHHLLTHTSGISGDGLLPYQCDETADQLVALAMKRPLAWAVGEKFEYANVGYSLLGVIVEKASGQKFEAFLRENIFKPAGMKDTGFVQDKALDAKRATVRMDKDSKSPMGSAIEWGWSWGYRGMGGIVTTAYDLQRFDRAMRGDKILGADAKKREMTPEKEGYGCGCLVQTTDRGKLKIQHSGSVTGYLCNIVRFIDDDAILIILSNQDCDLGGIERALTEVLFPPLTLTVEINVKGQKLNEGGGLVITEGASWKAARSDRGVVMSLETKSGTPVKVTFPREAAAGLVHQIQDAIATRKNDGEKDDGSMEAGVYTGGLSLEDGHLELSHVEFRLQEGYSGVDANGKEVADSRMTLVLLDPASGQWPLMAKMSLTAAGQFVKEMKAALDK